MKRNDSPAYPSAIDPLDGFTQMLDRAAAAALAQATDVVGYIPYVARVAPRPGLTLHATDNL